ncbi:hypothetical protein D3C71_2082960 [compost metagenome]
MGQARLSVQAIVQQLDHLGSQLRKPATGLFFLKERFVFARDSLSAFEIVFPAEIADPVEREQLHRHEAGQLEYA